MGLPWRQEDDKAMCKIMLKYHLKMEIPAILSYTFKLSPASSVTAGGLAYAAAHARQLSTRQQAARASATML
jgi:hypothetical protein